MRLHGCDKSSFRSYNREMRGASVQGAQEKKGRKHHWMPWLSRILSLDHSTIRTVEQCDAKMGFMLNSTEVTLPMESQGTLMAVERHSLSRLYRIHGRILAVWASVH